MGTLSPVGDTRADGLAPIGSGLEAVVPVFNPVPSALVRELGVVTRPRLTMRLRGSFIKRQRVCLSFHDIRNTLYVEIVSAAVAAYRPYRRYLGLAGALRLNQTDSRAIAHVGGFGAVAGRPKV
jgi:hypothetical protein